MKLLVLHLSDLHFETGKPFGEDRIASIVTSSLNVDNEAVSLLIVLSGDISCRGLPAYDIAQGFLSSLKAKYFLNIGAHVEVRVIAVAGNHDVDTSHLSDEVIGMVGSEVLRAIGCQHPALPVKQLF